MNTQATKHFLCIVALEFVPALLGIVAMPNAVAAQDSASEYSPGVIAQPESASASDPAASDVLPSGVDIQPLPPVEPLPELNGGSSTTPRQPQAFGMGGMGGMGMGGMGGGQGPIGYSTTWYPSVSLKDQPGNWEMVAQDFSFAAPVWSCSTASMVLLTGGVHNRLIDTDAIMPDSGTAYPENLWNISLGLMYLHQMAGSQTIAAGANVGSASDRPFASIDEMNVSVFGMYRRPSGERNAWTFGAFYSPTSEIQFPLPMVAYFWNPSDKFQMNIGLPLMVRYKPDDRWTFEVSYMLIHTINAKATYQCCDWLKVVGGYSSTAEAYSLYDRTDSSDRFFLYSQRVSLGLESPVTKWLTVDLAGGYAFGRYSYTGTQWDSAQYDRVDIADGPFVTLSASLRR